MTNKVLPILKQLEKDMQNESIHYSIIGHCVLEGTSMFGPFHFHRRKVQRIDVIGTTLYAELILSIGEPGTVFHLEIPFSGIWKITRGHNIGVSDDGCVYVNADAFDGCDDDSHH